MIQLGQPAAPAWEIDLQRLVAHGFPKGLLKIMHRERDASVCQRDFFIAAFEMFLHERRVNEVGRYHSDRNAHRPPLNCGCDGGVS